MPHEVWYQCGRPKEDTWQAKSAMQPARICCRRFGSDIEPGPRTRLKPLVPILVSALERHGLLTLASTVRARVLVASAATLDAC